MSRVVTAPTAERDIDDLAAKTAQRFGLEAGHRFLTELYKTAALVAEHPEMGRRRDELGPRVRSFPVGPVVLFYRPIRGGIEVARVLHGARDIPTAF